MDMDANSAIGFCKDQKTVSQKLNILKQLGLGYLTPGEETPSLSNMPERCPKPKDLALAAKGYRYLIVKNYLVFYVIVGDTVQIRRILYARRDYRSLAVEKRTERISRCAPSAFPSCLSWVMYSPVVWLRHSRSSLTRSQKEMGSECANSWSLPCSFLLP